VELSKPYDEWVVRIGGFKRHVLLPRQVASYKSVKANAFAEILAENSPQRNPQDDFWRIISADLRVRNLSYNFGKELSLRNPLQKLPVVSVIIKRYIFANPAIGQGHVPAVCD
jgi:hypothetical protein